MEFEGGQLCGQFVSDSEKMEWVMEDGYMVIQDKKICKLKDLLGMLEGGVERGGGLLVMGEDVEREGFRSLVVKGVGGELK